MKNILKHTHALPLGVQMQLSLETLQLIFSCRASNSPRRDGEPLAGKNSKRRVKQEKTEQNRLFSISSAPQVTSVFFLLEIRQVKKQVLLIPTNTEWHILKKTTKSIILLYPKHPLLLTFYTGFCTVLFSWISRSLHEVFILILRLLKLKSFFLHNVPETIRIVKRHTVRQAQIFHLCPFF